MYCNDCNYAGTCDDFFDRDPAPCADFDRNTDEAEASEPTPLSTLLTEIGNYERTSHAPSHKTWITKLTGHVNAGEIEAAEAMIDEVLGHELYPSPLVTAFNGWAYE